MHLHFAIQTNIIYNLHFVFHTLSGGTGLMGGSNRAAFSFASYCQRPHRRCCIASLRFGLCVIIPKVTFDSFFRCSYCISVFLCFCKYIPLQASLWCLPARAGLLYQGWPMTTHLCHRGKFKCAGCITFWIILISLSAVLYTFYFCNLHTQYPCLAACV